MPASSLSAADRAELVERMARGMACLTGHSPDTRVLQGEPFRILACGAMYYAVPKDGGTPLWRAYLAAAEVALDEVLKQPAQAGAGEKAAQGIEKKGSAGIIRG